MDVGSSFATDWAAIARESASGGRADQIGIRFDYYVRRFDEGSQFGGFFGCDFFGLDLDGFEVVLYEGCCYIWACEFTVFVDGDCLAFYV